MSNKLENFLTYALDTITTGEEAFIESIRKNQDLFEFRYFNQWEKMINESLPQTAKTEQAESLPADESSSEESAEEFSMSEDEQTTNDDNEQTDESPIKLKKSKKFNNDETILPGRIQRLLRLVGYLVEFDEKYFPLYEKTLRTLVQHDEKNLSILALCEALAHSFEETEDEKQRLKLEKIIELSENSFFISASKLCSSFDENDWTARESFLDQYFDVIYPFRSESVDIHRTLVDATSFLIDGDAFLFGMSTYVNLNLNELHGNTIHLIYLLEKILASFREKATKINWKMVFFDENKKLLENERPILLLIRQVWVFHLKTSLGENICREFSSAFDTEYKNFVSIEDAKLFLTHDLSKIEKDEIFSDEARRKLRVQCRRVANLHQYRFKLDVFLTNSFRSSQNRTEFFRIGFRRRFPNEKFREKSKIDGKKDEAIFPSEHEDLRLSIYRTTIERFKTDFDAARTAFFLLHGALLARISIEDRNLSSFVSSLEYSAEFHQSIDLFQRKMATIRFDCFKGKNSTKIVDLFDGNLFFFTLHRINLMKNEFSLDSKTIEILRTILPESFGPISSRSFTELFDQLLANGDVSVVQNFQPPNEQNFTTETTVMKISNPLIDQFLKPILQFNEKEKLFEIVPVNEEKILLSPGQSHRKELLQVDEDLERITLNEASIPKTQKRLISKAQNGIYRYFNFYGECLESNQAREYQVEVKLPKSQEEQVQEGSVNPSKTGKAKGDTKNQKKGGKTPTLSAADRIRKENEERKREKVVKEERERFENLIAQFKLIPKEDLVRGIKHFDQAFRNMETPEIRLNILERKFQLENELLNKMRKIPNRTREQETRLEQAEISFFATLADIENLRSAMDPFDEYQQSMELLTNQKKLTKENWYRFQIERINSRLPRKSNNKEDIRIPDYAPDPWQVQFLDAIDAEKSMIIVAPTASGKTDASFYVMKKILKEDSDVCIYVSPTKSLTNQIIGTIQRRYGSVFGVLQTDYKFQLDNCRILVTMHSALETLIMSKKFKKWSKNLKYCIFDEIHCMSDNRISSLWERNILLLPCALIGLSATVNNGEQMLHWLERVEEKRHTLFATKQRREVSLITHHERLGDLHKYIYANGEFRSLHPLSLFNGTQLARRILPKDFALSPLEALRLRDAMNNSHLLHDDPDLKSRFQPYWIIERNRFNIQAKSIYKDYQSLLEQKTPEQIGLVSDSLRVTAENFTNYPEMKPMSRLIGEFVLALKDKNLLPCIVFTDSRNLCERLARDLTEYFENMEEELRQTKYKEKIERIQERARNLDKLGKRKVKKRPTTKTRGEDEQNESPADIRRMEEEDRSEMELSDYEKQMLYGVLDEATLANVTGQNQHLVSNLLNIVTKANPEFSRCLKRGIGFHHLQLKNKSRLAIEGLYRNRYVQVIFSTWDLALGVHMPTKTTAFVQDSFSLDSLQYRQSTGRAGRRGFDVQGNVVFIDIPVPKIRHLTMSSIPNITTSLSFGYTTFLRLFQLYSTSDEEKDTRLRSILLLLSPFVAQTMEDEHFYNSQTRVNFLFALELLYRLNLIDQDGRTVGVAGLCTSIRKLEPTNLLFAHLLNNRAFKDLTQDEIIRIFAEILADRPWFESKSVPSQTFLLRKTVALDGFPHSILQHVESYNKIVREFLSNYVHVVSAYLHKTMASREVHLPLTNVLFDQVSDYDNGTFEYQLHHHHSQQKNNPSISPFAGPSALTHQRFVDNFQGPMTALDLTYSLDLSSEIIPIFNLERRDHAGRTYLMNNYLLNFLQTGKEKRVIVDNDIDRSNTYRYLSRPLDGMLSMSESLKSISHVSPDEFRSISNRIGDISMNFSKIFDVAMKRGVK